MCKQQFIHEEVRMYQEHPSGFNHSSIMYCVLGSMTIRIDIKRSSLFSYISAPNQHQQLALITIWGVEVSHHMVLIISMPHQTCNQMDNHSISVQNIQMTWQLGYIPKHNLFNIFTWNDLCQLFYSNVISSQSIKKLSCYL